MNTSEIQNAITGNPALGIAGLQNDWWTKLAPDIWCSTGSFLQDISGIRYLDLCGFFGTAPVRFDHPKLREKSFLDKIARTAMYRPSLSDFWTEEMALFIQIFRETATPSYMHHFFFIDGGALSVENALKTAFDWKVRLNIEKGKIKSDPQEDNRPLGTNVISFENGFHGRSGYTLSLTHTNDPRKYKYFPRFDWFKINPPICEFDTDGQIINQDKIKRQQESALNQIKTICSDHADDIAAILIEPVQCEGGDRHIPKNFFVSLRSIANTHDILLIYDEIQTGFGTTGKMWAHEHFNSDTAPDIITFCKKAQVGGIMANGNKMSRVNNNVFSDTDEGKNRLNSTWGGNPVDMLRCSAILGIIKEENLLNHAQEVGNHFLDGMKKLAKQYNGLISNPRGMGMLLAFDAASQDLQSRLWKSFFDQQLICLTCGEKTIRFRPHLDMTLAEAEEGLSRIEKGIQTII